MASQDPALDIFNDEVLAKSLRYIRNLEESLSFLISLSAEERACLPRLHSGHVSFVTEIRDLCIKNPSFLPEKFGLDEFSRDVELAKQLSQLEAVLTCLTQRVADTLLSVKSDMYISALEAFGHLQAGSEGDGLEADRDELRQYFRKNRNRLNVDQEIYN